MANTDFWNGWGLIAATAAEWKSSNYSLNFVLNNWNSWDPLITTLVVCGVVAFFCWFLSILTKNYSWVDKIWSITPAVYAWLFLLKASAPAHPRLIVMTVLPSIWGARLTYNFYRKGGYTWHGEDYRWKEIQSRVHWILYQVFNITFIAPYQNVLLWLIISPMWIVFHHQQTPWNILDTIATVTFGTLLLIETIADQQQWNFHAIKHQLQTQGPSSITSSEYKEDAKRGFLASKLFRYSRHPNFFCEMSMW
jgi:steroid 5-alpha reductase family enzyme